MAAQVPELTAMLALVHRMLQRARDDCLIPNHPVRVRARELREACEQRFEVRPAQCSSPYFVDCYVRAYAAWHAHTGEE